MATIAQVDKLAVNWFNDQMRRRGFAVEKKFTFWRKRGPLYDIFSPHILTGGLSMRMNISIWSPWIDSSTGELGNFPPQYYLVGGDLSEDFPEKLLSGEIFPINTPEEMDICFKKLIQLMDAKVLPWLIKINSCESYISYVNSRGFLANKERKEQIKLGIERGFLNEVFL
jgi:hypothetical protein